MTRPSVPYPRWSRTAKNQLFSPPRRGRRRRRRGSRPSRRSTCRPPTTPREPRAPRPAPGREREPASSRPTIRVEKREAVGVDGHRPFDDVPDGERRPSVDAGVGVDEVDRLVVGTEDDLGHPVGTLPHRGLARPPRPAPLLRLAPDHRDPAHRGVGVRPGHRRGGLGERAGPVPRAGRVPPEHGETRRLAPASTDTRRRDPALGAGCRRGRSDCRCRRGRRCRRRRRRRRGGRGSTRCQVGGAAEGETPDEDDGDEADSVSLFFAVARRAAGELGVSVGDDERPQ